MIRLPTIPLDATNRTPAIGTGSDVTPFQDQTGRELEQAGGALQDAGVAAARWQMQIDHAKVQQADNALAAAQEKALHDPTSGYLNLLGQDAVNQRKQVIDNLKQQQDAIANSLDTDRQRNTFALSANARTTAAMASVDQHAAQQTKVYAIGETEQGINQARNDAFHADPGTPQFEVQKGLMLRRVEESMALQGIPADSQQTKERKLAETSHLASLVVGDMLTTDRATEADAYLKKAVAAGEVDPHTQDMLQAQLEHQGDTDKATRLADKVMQQVDAETMRQMSAAETVKNPVTGATTTWTRAVDPLELRPREQLVKYQAAIKQAFDSGQIDAKGRQVAEAQVEHQVGLNVSRRADAIGQLERDLQDWENTHPLDHVSTAPATLVVPLQRYGMQATLDNIQIRADTRRAGLLQKQITASVRDLNDLTGNGGNSPSNNKQYPSWQRLAKRIAAGEADAEDKKQWQDVQARYLDSTQKINAMLGNINEWRDQYKALLKGAGNLPGSYEDPIKQWMRAFSLVPNVTPGQIPTPPSEEGGR